MPSNHLNLCHPFLLQLSIFTSIRVFSNESVLPIKWPKFWSFSFSISPSNEYSGLISFRIDWLDFLAIQGTLKSLLQHHSSKASILWCSAFFMVQLSHPHMTTGKTIALTKWTLVGKVVSRFLIVNNAAMNIWVHISFWIIVLSRYMPRSGIAESYGNSSCSSVILACNFLIVWCLCVVLVSEWLWPRRMSLVPLQFFGRVSEGELSMIIIESYIC